VANRVVVPSATWTQVKASTGYDAWFEGHLRCSRAAYLQIAANVVNAWPLVYRPLLYDSNFHIDDRVASMFHYVTHSDGLDTTAAICGISKTRAYEYYNEVVLVLQLCFLADTAWHQRPASRSPLARRCPLVSQCHQVRSLLVLL